VYADRAQERADREQERADLAQEAADRAQDDADEEQDRAGEAQELADEAQELADEARERAEELTELAEERGFGNADDESGWRGQGPGRPQVTVRALDRATMIMERFDRFRERADALLAVISEEWERAFDKRRDD